MIELSIPPDILTVGPFLHAGGQFMRLICALLLAGILAAAAATASFAADRPTPVALVIGNANYPDNDSVLNDAANDARDVAEELRRDGFAVEIGINLTGEAIGARAVVWRIEQGGIALLFYGGFGVQTTTRQTYLLPVDAQIWTEADVARDRFDLESVLDQMNSHGAAIKIALLDASRRNSFEPRFRRYSAGLAAAVTPVDTLVLYSTAVGFIVSTSRNDHSLFVTKLLKEMRAPGVTAEQALRNTQAGERRHQPRANPLAIVVTDVRVFAQWRPHPPVRQRHRQEPNRA